jgi:FkbM family methyltransferase
VVIREYGGEILRLYKTGDLARWNHDGDIEYLGRDDHQVKIRGQRVELGEIDACLERLPQVRSARTLLPSTSGASMLVSFVVRESEDTDEATAAQDIRAAAEAILPSHMRPSRICFVTEFPTTDNGKLARNELLAQYDRTRAVAYGEEEKIRSGSLIDQRLTSTWTSVLGAPAALRGDSNFFLEGGDSIKALRLLGLLRKQGIELSIHDLYVSQTLEQLDARIREVGDAGTRTGLTGTPLGVFDLADQPLTAEEKNLEDLYPLTTLQEVMYAQSLLNQDAAVYRDVFVVRVARPVDPALVRAMILSMTSEHAVLRTRVFQRDHGDLAQGIVRHSDVDFSVTTLGDAEDFDATVDRMVRRLKRHQFNTVDDPLILFRLVQNSRKATLVVCFHHMILDGWSVASLIVQLFRSVSHGHLVHGASSKYRFADYVALERAESRSPESATYWANTLDGVAPCLLNGPVSRNGSVSQDNVAHEIVQISRAEHGSLADAARRIGAPLKSILMTMHGYALARLFNHERIVTGYVVDGRPEFENYESVLGLHLNTLPIVLDFAECSAADVARKAASQEVENLRYRRYPLHSITRDAKRGKLFDTVFNFTSFHVYDEGEDDASLVEDVEPHEFTDFDFVSSFSIHPKSKELRLRLDFNSAVVTAEQVAVIRQAYGEIIGKLIRGEEAGVLGCATAQDDVRRALATARTVHGVERVRDATQDGACEPCLELTPTADAVPQLAYFARHPELKTHRLSNDLVISVINRTEADFNFREVFEDSYFKRLALALPAQATVFDVGGNVGLFTLSLFDEHPDMRFFVYEPMPDIASVLRHNMRAHRVSADVVQKALSGSIGKADFVFYENNTLISGLYADVGDIEVTAQALINQHDVSAENDRVNMTDLIADRLSTRTVEVETTTLAAEILRLGISTIDLLKIDVEKAEMDVLAGIDADGWKKIRNLYIEVHDIEGRLAEITSMLVRQGFFVVNEQETLLRGTEIHVLAASRNPISLRHPSALSIWRSSERQMALNVNAALDQAGLDSNTFEVRVAQPARSLAVPRGQGIGSSFEDEAKLKNLWATMFGEHPLDLDKSFYELGVDSISLLRLLRRANVALGSNTPVAAVKVDMTPREFLALGTNYHGAVVVQPVSIRQNAPVLLFVIPFATTPRIYDEVIQELTSTYSVKVLRASEQAYRDGNFDRILDEQFDDWRRDALSASAIVGWSLGGNLALAISESLYKREGRCPDLVLIDNYFCNDKLKIDDFKADIEDARQTDDYLEERVQLLKGYRPVAAPARGLYIKAIQNQRSRLEGVVEGGVHLKEGARVEIDADHFTIMQGNAAAQVARAIGNFVGIEIDEKLEAV